MTDLPSIRLATPELLQTDLDAGRIVMHPDMLEGLSEAISGGEIDFYVAESYAGEPRGQAGIRWVGPDDQNVRDVLGLQEGEVVANIGFVEVPERHRNRGIASALLSEIYTEAQRRGHRRIVLGVAVGNIAARVLYARDGFVSTGLRLETEQYVTGRQEDGSDPVMTEMDYWVKELPISPESP